MKYKCKKTS